MILSDRFDGSTTPFEGDKTLLLRSIPANAKVLKAEVKVTPVSSTIAQSPFEEIFLFNNGIGDWGATKSVVSGRWVEIDFHNRRTLAGVIGSNLFGTTLQIDLGGGVYVEINQNGAIRTPEDDVLFSLHSNQESLPSFVATKFKLTNPANTSSSPSTPDVTGVRIRSVPTNITIRVAELPPFWVRLGELIQPETSADFSEVLQVFLADAEIENGFYVVPIVLHSDTIARLTIDLGIEYSLQQNVLPETLNEVTLPYEYGTVSNSEEDVLEVSLPSNARVLETNARAIGSFDESRIVHGPTGAVTTEEMVKVSPSFSQAQLISLDKSLAATAIDLLIASVDRTARLQVDIRENLAGKPDSSSLLPKLVDVELDREVAGSPTWVSVPLPTEFQFKAGNRNRYWLVLQSIDGEAAWSVIPGSEGDSGMQQTQDGGFSWRNTTVAGIDGSPAALFRLRHTPERYQVPVELQIGTGEQAVRVSLDRFQPLGRVDFSLDLHEVAEAFNEYLANTTPPSCPGTEHLANGDFERWFSVGNRLMRPRNISLNGSPRAVEFAPDGLWAYVARNESDEPGFLQIIDVACNKKVEDGVQTDLFSINIVALNPDGTRAYVASNTRLQLVDTRALRTLGVSLDFGEDTIVVLTVSPDGARLYVIVNNELSSIDTAKLEKEVLSGQPSVTGVTLKTLNFGTEGVKGEVTSMAVAPDGRNLYVVVDNGTTSAGEVHIVDTSSFVLVSNPIEVGLEPTAIALTPNGSRAVVVNSFDGSVTIINTEARTSVGSIEVGNSPVAVAISPDGNIAYVVNHGNKSLSIVDLARRTVAEYHIPDDGSPFDITVTPEGDRVYVLNEESMSLTSIPVGIQLPAEWSLTSGRVSRECLPEPFHQVALLGAFENVEEPSLPTALSQVVPVTGSCTYEFSFWGITNEPDAIAEILWLGSDCSLLRTDQIKVDVCKTETDTLEHFINIVSESERPPLIFHRIRLTAPVGSNQAEVRFSTPIGVVAHIDRVSLFATDEVLANSDFTLRTENELRGWNLLTSSDSFVPLFEADQGIRIPNNTANPIELTQTVPVQSGQPFTLEFEGSVVAQSEVNPNVELCFLDDHGAEVGSSTVLEISPTGLDRLAAKGTSPSDATQAEIHLIVPSLTTLEVRRVSLRFSQSTVVPVSFIAHAPGELTVSDWQVAYETVETPPPRVPDSGLCTPTPPGLNPGESSTGCCYCACCETERKMKDAVPVMATGDRPAVRGVCPTCEAELISFGGARISGASSLSHLVSSARRPVVLPLRDRGNLIKSEKTSTVVEIKTPLTLIKGIGEKRAKWLSEIGIDSLEKLAVATPQDVIRALRVISPEMAAGFIKASRQFLKKTEEP